MDEETIRETAWNFCKKYDASGKRRCLVWLRSYVSDMLEELFGEKIENLYRTEAQEEVFIFCQKYGYAA